MKHNHSSFRFNVKIQCPAEYNPLTRQMELARDFNFRSDERGGPSDDILAIIVKNTIHSPCGTFSLTMTPRIVDRGMTWADLIPSYSLVEIWVERLGEPEDILMVGLVTNCEVAEDWSQREPRREVRVSGMAVSCVFVHQQVFYLNQDPKTLKPSEPYTWLSELRPDSAEARQPDLFGPAGKLLGTMIMDPDLAFIGGSPIDVFARFFDYLKGVLNWSLPRSTIQDVLIFDPAKATLFDPRAELVPASQLPSNGAPLWSLLSTWQDPAYQELFTDSYARYLPLGRAAVEVTFRKKPFAGRIDDFGNLVDVPGLRGSQLDPDLATIPLDAWHVLSATRGKSAADLASLIYVEPVLLTDNADFTYRETHLPLMDTDPASPSFVRRFGLRLLQVKDYYLEQRDKKDLSGALASQREQLLLAWHRFAPLFWGGTISVIGSPRFRAGMRLTWDRREFYLAGVSHVIDIESGQYLTTLQVERGWVYQS